MSHILIIPFANPPYNYNPEDPHAKEVQGMVIVLLLGFPSLSSFSMKCCNEEK